MNKKKLLIFIGGILLFSLLIIGGTVLFLDSNEVLEKDNIILDCEKKGEKAFCSLKGNSYDNEVSAVSAMILVNSGDKLLNIDVDSSWEGDGEDGSIEVYTDTNKTGIFDIATFEVSLDADSDNIISVEDVEFYDREYFEYEVESVSEEIG